MHAFPASLPGSLPAALLTLLLSAPVVHGWLGIYFDPSRDEAVVHEAIAGSPADKAGLKPGDVLLTVGDKKTPTREDFIAAMRATKAGEEVTIKVRRGDEELSVAVRLVEPPADVPPPTTEPPAAKPRTRAPAPMTETPAVPPGKAEAQRGYLGVSIVDDDGKIVVERVLAGSPAAAAAVRAGDVITRIEGQAVTNRDQLDAAMQKRKPGDKVAVELRNEEAVRSVTVTLGTLPGEVAAEQATPKAAPGRTPKPAATAKQRPRSEAELEAELQALRAELAEIRRLLEELRKGKE